MPFEFSTMTGVLPGTGIGFAGRCFFGFAGGGLACVVLTFTVADLPVDALCTCVTTVAVPPCAGGAATGAWLDPRCHTMPTKTVTMAARSNPMARRRVTRRTPLRCPYTM